MTIENIEAVVSVDDKVIFGTRFFVDETGAVDAVAKRPCCCCATRHTDHGSKSTAIRDITLPCATIS